MVYTQIKDIAFINSHTKKIEDIPGYFAAGLFSQPETWQDYQAGTKVEGLKEGLAAPLGKSLGKRMSELSLGICNALNLGPVKDPQALSAEEEIYLFTGFGEIDTTNKILHALIIEQAKLVSPTLFHNSVHNTALGYFTILHKLTNYCATITDGIKTNLSFIYFINYLAALQKTCVICAGDEYSSFFELDTKNKLDLSPLYLAYRIEPHAARGFVYGGSFASFEEFTRSALYAEQKVLFCPRQLFFQCTALGDQKQVYTDYGITRDNPCGIVFRLALPFVLSLGGLVLEEVDRTIHCFKVVI